MPNILDPRFKYHNAASHSDPEPFKQRMAERMVRAVHKQFTAEFPPPTAVVVTIPKKERKNER